MAPEQAPPKGPQLNLPTLVFGVVEVRRLQRELESVDAYFEQNKLRPAGQQGAGLKISRLLDTVAHENNINLQHAAQRAILATFLRQVVDHAPVVHISFAADPSAVFTAKIVEWLRAKVHPLALLQLGLQPSIAAGCIVRTPNHVFDFSLRHRFNAQHAVLMQTIKGATSER
jgi:hypothetical protein